MCHAGTSCAGNILLASTSTVPHGFAAKVSDFGLAREMDIQSKIATNTTGTVTYMPPETIADGMVSKVCSYLSLSALKARGRRALIPRMTILRALAVRQEIREEHEQLS